MAVRVVLDHRELQAVAAQADVLGLQTRRALRGDAPHIEIARLQARPQARAMRVVDVDDRGL
ncbi:hypothetical protein D3C78_1769060 [compost metagenome]